MTPEVPVAAAPVAEKIKIKRPLFDLANFVKTSAEKEIEFTPVTSMAEFLKRIDNDDAKALKVANAGLRRIAQTEAKQEMGSDNLVSPKVVSGFLNQFRPMFPLKNDSKEAKKEQSEKVTAYVRGIPALVEAIKVIAAATVEVDDDEETTEETE